jgi:probable rRNA maturation factor
VIINVINEQQALIPSSKAVQQLVAQVLKEENQKCDEVTIYFVDTPTICQLHEHFFGDPSPTDCISFPMDEEDSELDYRLLGDVFVCPQTAIEYTQAQKLADPYEEMALYIVHGLLHLIGYDDIEENDRDAMRAAEKRCMTSIKKLGLHLNS